MPRFYFDISDGAFIPDALGVDLPDVEHARQEAVARSAALLKHQPNKFWEGEEWLVEVTDEYGLGLFTLAFSARAAPSTRRPPQVPSRSDP